jgi:hypothetical protein
LSDSFERKESDKPRGHFVACSSHSVLTVLVLDKQLAVEGAFQSRLSGEQRLGTKPERASMSAEGGLRPGRVS